MWDDLRKNATDKDDKDYLDASDLKKYEKTNEYNKGKQFPFADDQTDYSDGTSDNVSASVTSEINKRWVPQSIISVTVQEI